MLHKISLLTESNQLILFGFNKYFQQLFIIKMMDYYFCEECQTFHQPNRKINGEFLTACQCQISTQTATLTESRQSYGLVTPKKNFIIPSPTPAPSYHIYKGQKILSQERLSQSRNFQNTPSNNSPYLKYDNLPFLAITADENKGVMQKIIRDSHNKIKSQNKLKGRGIIAQPLSPRIVRAPMPLARKNEIVQRQLPLQPPLHPIKQVIQPIQYNEALSVYPQSPRKVSSKKKLSITSQKQILSEKNEKSSTGSRYQVVKRFSLDRTIGDPSNEYQQQKQKRAESSSSMKTQQFVQYSRIQLDRVAQEKNVIGQGHEKSELCGNFCY